MHRGLVALVSSSHPTAPECALCWGLDWTSFPCCYWELSDDLHVLCPQVCIPREQPPGQCCGHLMSINNWSHRRHTSKRLSISCQAHKEKVNLDNVCTWEYKHNPGFKGKPLPLDRKVLEWKAKYIQPPCHHVCEFSATIPCNDLWLVQRPVRY